MSFREDRSAPGPVLLPIAVGLAVSLALSQAVAHEGHAPLPTKGVQVDAAKGLLTLSPDAQKSLGVQIAPAEKRELASTVLAYVTLVTPWQQQYFVSPPISGRIARMHVATGETVEKGQLLAELSSPELEAVRLDLKNALREIELSERQVVRLRALVESNALPARDLLEAETKQLQNQNVLEIARSKFKSLGFGRDQLQEIEADRGNSALMLPVVSPLAGMASHTDLAVGKVVAPAEHLFKITDLSTLWVQIGVLERDLGKVRKGQEVSLELSAFPGEKFRTSVTHTSVFVDPKTHLGYVWAELKNPSSAQQFLPGMYGLARIKVSPAEQVLTIPSSAVLGTGAERYVLVEVAKTGKGLEYQRQNIVVGARNSILTEVRGGTLYPGDQVVSRGGQVLSSFFVLGVLRLSPEGIRNVGLTVEPARPTVIQEVIEFDGLVDLPPDRVATVSAQLTGVLHRVLVDRGQKVEAGQTVAEVTGLQLQDTQLEMVRSQLEAEQYNTTLRRLEPIRNTQAVAARRIWEIENQRDLAVNRRESGKRTLAALGMSDEQIDSILQTGEPIPVLPVRAPIGGVVVRLDKTPGETIGEEESILQIEDLSRPWIQGFASEVQARRIPIGTSVRVRLIADPGFIGEGTVARSAQSFTGLNRSLSVWIDLKEMPKQLIQRNLLARISAVVGSHPSQLAVPNSAILRDGARTYVFVQKDGGLIERRAVEAGPADDRFVAIRKGLSQGERVAVQGVAELQTTYASVR